MSAWVMCTWVHLPEVQLLWHFGRCVHGSHHSAFGITWDPANQNGRNFFTDAALLNVQRLCSGCFRTIMTKAALDAVISDQLVMTAPASLQKSCSICSCVRCPLWQEVRDDALHMMGMLSRNWEGSVNAAVEGVVIGNLQDSCQQFQYQLSAKIARCLPGVLWAHIPACMHHELDSKQHFLQILK